MSVPIGPRLSNPQRPSGVQGLGGGTSVPVRNRAPLVKVCLAINQQGNAQLHMGLVSVEPHTTAVSLSTPSKTGSGGGGHTRTDRRPCPRVVAKSSSSQPSSLSHQSFQMENVTKFHLWLAEENPSGGRSKLCEDGWLEPVGYGSPGEVLWRTQAT